MSNATVDRLLDLRLWDALRTAPANHPDGWVVLSEFKRQVVQTAVYQVAISGGAQRMATAVVAAQLETSLHRLRAQGRLIVRQVRGEARGEAVSWIEARAVSLLEALAYAATEESPIEQDREGSHVRPQGAWNADSPLDG